jgi:uncharacterized ion transporter superfamily protein YfcC
MELDGRSNRKQRIWKTAFRILKTTAKVVIVGIIYLFLSQFLAPASVMIPGLQDMIATFLIIYVVLMVVCDLTSGTILQHFFSGAKSLFVIAYLIFSLNSGILEYTFGSVNLIIDLRLFLVVAMLLEMLGLAKSVMQGINFMNEKAELPSL